MGSRAYEYIIYIYIYIYMHMLANEILICYKLNLIDISVFLDLILGVGTML